MKPEQDVVEDRRPARTAVRTSREQPASPLARLQATAGNAAVRQLVGGQPSVHRYRNPKSHNFGAADTATLKEDRFRGTKAGQPRIDLVEVNFDSVVDDANKVPMPKGTLTATYASNAAAKSGFSFTVTGGPSGMPSDPGEWRVHRIEGVGYNDPSSAKAIAKAEGKGALEGPKRGKYRRYTKPKANELPEQVAASMHFAVFYNRGEAVHDGFLDQASHGCVHVDSWDLLKQLNYHSAIGHTRVRVSYSGPAKTKFDP